MDQRRVTNALLLVIAVCLVLIVANLYGLGSVSPAEAQPGIRPQPVELMYRGADDVYHPMADRNGRIYSVSSPR